MADDTLPRGETALFDLFRRLSIDPPLVEHEAHFTVAESQGDRGAIPGTHTKNLFLKDKKGGLFLLTAPEDAVIDLKVIHKQLGGRGRVSFGSADALAAHLGVRPGSVTPLGLINDPQGAVTFFVHPEIEAARLVNVHPLRNTATVTLTGDELFRVMDATGHPPKVLPPAQ